MGISSTGMPVRRICTEYERYLRKVWKKGVSKKDRTGTGTKSIFGHQMRFDLRKDGFPLITTKKIFTKGIIYELLWLLMGGTNVKWLQQHGVTIWDEWADENGELGPVYGKQWRNWVSPDGKRIDQISEALWKIKNRPDDRRIIVSAWNVGEIGSMRLPPCHLLFQFYVADRKLSCQLYQRSCDSFLGVPFNIASYALLTHMMAQQCNLEVGDFIWVGGDCHIYTNHFTQVQEQLLRDPRPFPELVILRHPESIFDYKYDDFKFIGYDPHPAIKGDVAV